jgi:two-component system sensor histidine kinase BaeS
MKAARKLAAGQYDVSVPVNGRNELAELATNFNQLARTLARNEQIRRQWIVDISHELRTPIAVIGGEVEAIIDGIRQPTPERMASLYGAIGALGQLVDDLHLLSLADQATLELAPQQVDLMQLIHAQLDQFQSRVQQQGLTLTLDTGTSCNFILYADARRLAQLVSNLLENSLRYTERDGEIHLSLQDGNDSIILEIQDTPPGVPEEALAKIFDRLYRVDSSRSRFLGGSGL